MAEQGFSTVREKERYPLVSPLKSATTKSPSPPLKSAEKPSGLSRTAFPTLYRPVISAKRRVDSQAFCALSAAVSPPRYLKIPCATISEGRGSDKESLRTGRSASVNLPTAGRHFFHSPPRIVKSYFQPQPSCGVILSPKR